jgi:hypothetical protein
VNALAEIRVRSHGSRGLGWRAAWTRLPADSGAGSFLLVDPPDLVEGRNVLRLEGAIGPTDIGERMGA